MRLDSVRALKVELASFLADPDAPLGATIFGLEVGRANRGSHRIVTPERAESIALGISSGNKDSYRLAVRIQRERSSSVDQIVEAITSRAKGEVDIREVGEVFKLGTPGALTQRARPILMGYSVGGSDTTGTVGCFVTNDLGKVCILSNNHILAGENTSNIGDPIFQPGGVDGGATPTDIVARLEHFVRLELTAINLMDCAIASVESNVPHDFQSLQGLGKLAGLRSADIAHGLSVAKVGRTTGLTRGRVSAFEMDGVRPEYRAGILRFNQQIEIESTEARRFSDVGDSGSLVVDEDNYAMGLLFAGTMYGGANNLGLTYATRLETILHKLVVNLCL